MLTRKQHELLVYINERLSEAGVSPSFEEMKEALDLKSKSGVHRLISALEERGFIKRLANRARALEVVRMPETKLAISGAQSASSAPVTVPRAANAPMSPLNHSVAMVALLASAATSHVLEHPSETTRLPSDL